jgi:monovalent cation:H+ antiporter-2, CPA2 family
MEYHYERYSYDKQSRIVQMENEFGLLINLSISLVVALGLGLLTDRLRLSPIIGYLLAGIVLGPQTPGFVADSKMAHDFAEIGVVLLMFGVGLHFNPRDLLAVRRIALPGAIGQIFVASLLGTVTTLLFGWRLGTGLIIGVAISVASTVVLVRVLMDNDELQTGQGQIAVGWLIVEDIFTVLVLVVLPGMSGILVQGEQSGGSPAVALALAIVKVGGLGLIVVIGGRKTIPWLLTQVARARSRELFTLAILALALAIATGSAVIFGVSMALGAFLAGMVVGQTEVSHQAASDSLPMKDAFAVLFFVSIGMLFDPSAILKSPWLLLSLLGIVVIAKPLAAFLIIWFLRYSIRTGLTVAVALAQIGEFSFLLANEAIGIGILSEQGQSLLVACSLISISANPLLYHGIDPLERWLRSKERVWRMISKRSMNQGVELNIEMQTRLEKTRISSGDNQRAVVVGYGPVGQTACRILKNFQIYPVVIDMNLETVRHLVLDGEFAIYGDATRRDILEAAGIRRSNYLLITIPNALARTVVILAAKELNPDLRVFARARYVQERIWLKEVGATGISTEEAETAIGLAVLLLHEVGADEDRIRKEINKIRRELVQIGDT